MKHLIPQAKATSEVVETRRKEWNDLVELHDIYNKHEVYDPDNHGEMCICKLCGAPLAKRYSWRSSGDKHEYKRMVPGAVTTTNDWVSGKLTEAAVKRCPKPYRHFLYEALLSRVAEESTQEEEMAAILSCRDASVPSESLRKYAVTTGGMFAYAFAKSQDDWADDLLVATRSSAKACCKFLSGSDKDPSDEDRIAVSKDPELALQFATHIDCGPHQVTRDGAARHPSTALSYATKVDKSPTTKTSRGTLLKTVVLRTADGIRNWTAAFPRGGKVPDDKSRKAACRTKQGAFNYAQQIDKGPHPDTEAVLIRSAYYGPRYMYEVAAAPVKDIERCFSGGYDALRYMGVFNIKPSPMLWDQCRRNSMTRQIYITLEEIIEKPIDKQAALKKSLLSAAYIMQNDLYNDKDLMKRAKKNRGYGWALECMQRTRKDVARVLAKRKAAAKPVATPTLMATVLPTANAAATYVAMCPPVVAKTVADKVAAKTITLKTAMGVRVVPVSQLP